MLKHVMPGHTDVPSSPAHGLANGELHLWIGPHALVDDDGIGERCRDALSDEEQVQYLRFPFERERRQYLVTRTMERAVLARYLACSPKDISLVTGEFGKPELHGKSGLHFNLSHCEGLTVLAVSHQMEVGVDVECRDRVFGKEDGLVRSMLSPMEQAALARTKERSFIDFWTLKEAFAKAIGRGLNEPFDKVEFAFIGNHEICLKACACAHGDPNRWIFFHLLADNRYLIALAARAVTHKPRPIALRTTLISTDRSAGSVPCRLLGGTTNTLYSPMTNLPPETFNFEDFIAQHAPEGSYL
jgi:4'-phosphopantetheinyl transferase